MKRSFILSIACFIALISSSCSKKFEQYPEDRNFESDIFDPGDKKGTGAKQFLFDIYASLPGGFNRIDGDYLDAATDDAVSSSFASNIVLFTNGQLTAANYPDNNWKNCYSIIRKSNFFLKHIGVVPIPDSVKNDQMAEARFLRAFAYFELLKRYGGVPLVGDTVFSLSDNLSLPRNTFAECVDYIASECDAAAEGLPNGAKIASADFGRVPSEAALALKCRLFLYAASPLYNGGGFEVNPGLKILTGYPDADPARWQKVITAAEALTRASYYKLPSGTGNTAYSAVFTTKINTDIILSKQSSASTSIEVSNAPVGFVAPAASNGRTSPTQNFVNAFPNQDGSPYTGSSTDMNQYNGRDPRMKSILFYNGVKWLGRNIETFEGGLDKPNLPFKTQTRTSYYLRKFMGDFTNSTSYSNQSHNFPYFRFAEVLLNYAEALNEVGRTEDAVAPLKLIRARAGITAGTNGRYGIPAGISQAGLRDLIRNERRIELSFEEHRFWDVRRWKIAGTVLNTTLKGLKIVNSAGSLTAEEQTVSTLTFQNKYYHMPVPYSEMIRNPRLIQNEGYN
ncbi:RagB/SusD family nutrient uptake outer membrane protein [Arcticibacter tournemirensis]|uniref:RagB/SusD family nutrient uptake outer membrane protein n=2 Tax=Pseudomonadati TaxID=3379134 RepID=A0A4V1KHW6_9SPHI|nr:RagB/SusD family nutrient uptake outer membrane protein [Arcticibacter tournemirensis]RXF68622.1 RagB/SusD family nutrient uptake outer membrane protein [Arcticibacter tournemirensis]